jgi:hypothetical protein
MVKYSVLILINRATLAIKDIDRKVAEYILIEINSVGIFIFMSICISVN